MMVRVLVDVFKRTLQGRLVAYNQVFNPQSPYTKVVLEDLAKFCRAHATTFHPDARTHAVLEGRREVWLRLQEHLQLDLNQLYDLHRIKEIKGE